MTKVKCSVCGQMREMSAVARAMPRHQHAGRDCSGSGTGRFSELVIPRLRVAVKEPAPREKRAKNKTVVAILLRYECPVCGRSLGQGPIRKVRRHRAADGKRCSGSGELRAIKVTTKGKSLNRSLARLAGPRLRVVSGGLPGLGKRR